MGSMPKSIQQETAGRDANVQAAYALAVYLFAPLAIIVPLTVSSAVGSQTIIGEREARQRRVPRALAGLRARDLRR